MKGTTMTEHADSRYALVRLRCRQHHRDHWLVLRDLPVPPPSADVLRHVVERFDCSGTPLAAEVVALFPPPLAVSWADLVPAAPAGPDAGAGNEPGTATPGVAPPASRQGHGPGTLGPGRGRGGHLIDEAYRLGLTPLTPLAPAAQVQAQAPDTVAPATASPTHTPAPPPVPDVRSWRTVVRRDGARLSLTRFQPFQTRRGIDTVIGLRFPYDAGLVENLKATLRQQRDVVRRATPHAQTAGGWLPAYHCWYIEPPAWPAVAALLRQYGWDVPIVV
jgi:hypothetical protein